MNPADLDLLQAYLDGALDDDQAHALEARLKAEPELAERLMLLARDEATLLEWSRAMVVAGRERTAAPSLNGVPAKPGRVIPLGARRWAVRAGMAAAVVLAVALFWKPATPVEKADALARLDDVQGEVVLISPTGQEVEARAGDAMFAGQEVRTGDGSFAVLRYADGTLIELSTLTRLRLEADGGAESPGVGKRLFLAEGVVNAEVASQPQGRPMVMTTPHAVIRVLGTRFNSAALAAKTRVELEEGRVRLTRTSDGQSIEVEEGRYAVAEAKGEPAAAPAEQFAPRLLPPRINRPRAVLPGGPGPVLDIARSRDGKMLAVAGWDGSVTLYDWASLEIRLVLKGHTRQVRALAFSPDGKLLATGSADKVVKVWDTAFGKELLTLPKHKQEVEAVLFAPDGQTLAVSAGFLKGKEGSQLKLWDVASGALKASLPNQGAAVGCVAFSPDGKLLAAGGKDGIIRLWDVTTQAELAVLAEHSDAINDVAFAPDGRCLASASRDSNVILWDLAGRAPLQTLRGHTREARGVAFAPDGLLLATCGTDGTARLWDVTAGKEMLTLRANKFAVTGVLFADDGRTLVTSGWDKTVRVWDLTEPAALLAPDR